MKRGEGMEEIARVTFMGLLKLSGSEDPNTSTKFIFQMCRQGSVFCLSMLCSNFCCVLVMYQWRGCAIGRASDLRHTGRGFESWLHGYHCVVALNSIIWYRPRG